MRKLILLAAFLLSVGAYAQGIGFIGTVGYAVSASCTSDYNASQSTGDRRASITVTTPAIFKGTGGGGGLVNGNKTEQVSWWDYDGPVAGAVLKFDFGSAVQITEAKYYQSDSSLQGTWKWQGSADDANWTDIGSSFSLGGVTTQTQTSLSGNTNSYRYYRLYGVSGLTTDFPWVYEFEFKICH